MAKNGRPYNMKAVKALWRLEQEHPNLTDREMALFLAPRIGKAKIDPKSVWRWRKVQKTDEVIHNYNLQG